MDETTTNPEEEQVNGEPETPEDVAVLYTWANVHGGKYRDFSASRREFRAQQRHRMVEAQREAELEAARAKGEAAEQELAEARRLEEETASTATDDATRAEAEEALHRAEEKAERERQEAQRHVETAEDLKRAMEQAEREMEEARRRAEEQAARWREADARLRAAHEDGEAEAVPGVTNDPYYYAGHLEPGAFAPGKGVRSSLPQRVSSERRISESYNRARGGRRSTDVPPEQREANGGLGLFVDRRRSDSEGVPPEATGERRRPQQLIEPRIETPEDTRERRRQDEIRRRSEDEARFDSSINDSYYDKDPGAVQPGATRAVEEMGSAASDLHIRPRTARTRASDYAAFARASEDPAPGNPRPTEYQQPRRRESSVDIAARTTRHPREPEHQPSGDWGRRNSDTERRGGGDSRAPQEQGGRVGRPEWFAGTAGEAPVDAPSTSTPPVEERAERRSRPRSEMTLNYLRNEEAAPVPEPEAPKEVPVAPAARPNPAVDTLQQSRERVASRWFALKGLVGEGGENTEQRSQAEQSGGLTVPMLAVVSLAGGVGKTSIVATIGRLLSAMGEKVLLADTTSYGLLPYYFGARALRPDVVRTFSPPPGSSDAPVYMVNYDTEALVADNAGQTRIAEQVLRHARGSHRALIDINASSAWLARQLARQGARILVPIAPDMNSIIGIQAVERSLAGITDGEGKPVAPYYVLNQFDPSLPLHLDVREVLRKQLGDRLLSVVIRRSPVVSEALAEGMTVMDYAPDSPVTEDYRHLAEWVRNLAASASAISRTSRWSER